IRIGCVQAIGVVLVALVVGALSGGAAGVLVPRFFDPRTPPAPLDRSALSTANITLRLTEESAVTQAAERVGPAVVPLQTTSRVSFFRSSEISGVGSGIIFDKRGYILTNKHVVEGAREVLAVLSDGRKLTVTVLGLDPLTDLAIVRLPDG